MLFIYIIVSLVCFMLYVPVKLKKLFVCRISSISFQMKYHCQYVNNARWSYVLFYVWIVFTPSRQYFSLNKQLSVVKFWSFFGGPCKPIFHRNLLKRSFACQGGDIMIRWYLINITEWPFRFYFMDISSDTLHTNVQARLCVSRSMYPICWYKKKW